MTVTGGKRTPRSDGPQWPPELHNHMWSPTPNESPPTGTDPVAPARTGVPAKPHLGGRHMGSVGYTPAPQVPAPLTDPHTGLNEEVIERSAPLSHSPHHSSTRR